MPGFLKRETTKAIPPERGNVQIRHNIYDLVGANLFRVYEEGRLTKKQTTDMLRQLSLEAEVDLGKGYGVNLGYNIPSRDRGQQHRIKFTKDIF